MKACTRSGQRKSGGQWLDILCVLWCIVGFVRACVTAFVVVADSGAPFQTKKCTSSRVVPLFLHRYQKRQRRRHLSPGSNIQLQGQEGNEKEVSLDASNTSWHRSVSQSLDWDRTTGTVDTMNRRTRTPHLRRIKAASALSSSSSSSSSSLKFRDMEDLLDSVAVSPNETLVIAFMAVHCGPCQLQKQELALFRRQVLKKQHQHQPQLQSQSSTFGTNTTPSSVRCGVKMLAIDTNKWPHVGRRFQVSKLPCLVILRNKQVIAQLDGLTKADVLMEHCCNH